MSIGKLHVYYKDKDKQFFLLNKDYYKDKDRKIQNGYIEKLIRLHVGSCYSKYIVNWWFA